jgi:hypothetical protein
VDGLRLFKLKVVLHSHIDLFFPTVRINIPEEARLNAAKLSKVSRTLIKRILSNAQRGHRLPATLNFGTPFQNHPLWQIVYLHDRVRYLCH